MQVAKCKYLYAFRNKDTGEWKWYITTYPTRAEALKALLKEGENIDTEEK